MSGTDQDLIAPPTVEQQLELDLPPDELWPVLTEPDGLDWLGESVDIDVRPGGTGVVIDDEGVVREVLVTAVEPGRRLAWHWWADTGDLSTVEITLAPSRSGSIVHVVETLAGEASVTHRALRPQASAAGMTPTVLGGLRSITTLVVSC